jgi:uncharacterized membrane protein
MQFIKTTFIGGLVFLVPIVIVVVVLGEAFEMMVVVAKPMSDWLPVDSVGGIALVNILALAAIALSCFIFGIIARTASAKNINRHLNKILIAIPGYAFVKGYADSMDRSAEKAKSFIPVLARFDDYSQLSFEIERTPRGNVVVYLPGAPNPWSGAVVFVEENRVERLDMSVSEAVSNIEKLGHGFSKFAEGKNK